MNKDQYQDQYKEVLQDLKEEKMNWNFEDFLQKTEINNNNEAQIIPLDTKKPSFPKWFWMAASVILLFGIGFIFNMNQNEGVENQAKWVENEILKQKSDFIKENHEHQTQVAINYSDSISGAKKDSIFQETSLAETDVLDEILSKKSRIKKETKPKYVSNSYKKYNAAAKDSTGYYESYVIVNGKKITSEKEAIDVATYSFMKMGNEFKKTVASSQKNENYTNDY